MLSRWEIQVTRLRAESLHPAACPSKTTGVKWATIGCVMERSIEIVVFT